MGEEIRLTENDMTIQIWRYDNSRQASFGFPTGTPRQFVGLQESYGEVDLTVQYGDPVEQVGAMLDSATDEEKWTALARFEEWTSTTYASQEAAREADRLIDALPEARKG
jgi:hypothetical protein